MAYELTAEDRRSLGNLLVCLDSGLNHIEQRVWDATSRLSPNDRRRQEILYDHNFRFPEKDSRDKLLAERNALARVLGLKERGIHDWSPRGYVERDGQLVAA